PYEKPDGKTLQLIDADVHTAGDPLLVAKKVHQIVQARNPKVHYKVGSFMQTFSVTLKKWLPGTLYERLLLRHYKL
ncbi:MAG: short-chain dehydrogenase/reductase, partial [Flavobacteriaceae bacterium]